MARKARVAYEGAIYHVMGRGNECARIFNVDEDYELFLKTLGEALERFSVDLHAYCLMPNHFHLAVQTPQGNLSRLMAWLQTTFTVRYNLRRRRSGHLFQGRYRAELVEDSTYGKWLVLYIHLNPIRSRRQGSVRYVGTLEDLNRFQWSSYRAWIGIDRNPLQRLKDEWLGEWGTTLSSARRAYIRNLRLEIEDQKGLDWKSKVEIGLAAGSEAFLDKMRKFLKGKKREMGGSESRILRLKRRGKEIEKVLREEKDPKIQLWIRVKLIGESQVQLAKEYEYATSAGVYLTIRRLEESAKENSSLKAYLSDLRKMYNVVD